MLLEPDQCLDAMFGREATQRLRSMLCHALDQINHRIAFAQHGAVATGFPRSREWRIEHGIRQAP
jgi:hypothetical protein